jgi:hypothetical protein
MAASRFFIHATEFVVDDRLTLVAISSLSAT